MVRNMLVNRTGISTDTGKRTGIEKGERTRTRRVTTIGTGTRIRRVIMIVISTRTEI